MHVVVQISVVFERRGNPFNLSLWWHSLGFNVGMYVLHIFDFPVCTVIAIFSSFYQLLIKSECRRGHFHKYANTRSLHHHLCFTSSWVESVQASLWMVKLNMEYSIMCVFTASYSCINCCIMYATLILVSQFYVFDILSISTLDQWTMFSPLSTHVMVLLKPAQTTLS